MSFFDLELINLKLRLTIAFLNLTIHLPRNAKIDADWLVDHSYLEMTRPRLISKSVYKLL